MSPEAPPTRRTILLLGNYRATVTLARELGKAGHGIVVGCAGDEEGGAEHSRYCTRVWRHPPAAAAAEFLHALQSLLIRDPEISVVLPASERYARLLASHWPELPQGQIYATPQPDCVLTCLDKDAMLLCAQRADVPVAPFRNATDLRSLEDAAEHVGYPLVIRPADSMKRLFNLKAVICSGSEELKSLFPSWPGGHDSLLVQRKVSGRRHNIYFAAHRGTPIRFLEAIVLRTDKPDGTGLAVDGVTVPLNEERRLHTTRLIRDLSYHGVGCAQFLVDEGAALTHFLEINPRIAGHHAVAERAGLGLSGLALALASGDSASQPPIEGVPGIRYAWTYGELRSLKSRHVAGELGFFGLGAGFFRAARTAILADMHVSWEWNDPGPTLQTYWNAFFSRRPRTAGRPTESLPQFEGSAVNALDR